MSDRCFIDGDFAQAKRITQWQTENPFDFQPGVRLYRATFRQLANNFSELPISSPFVAEKDDAAPAITGTWTLRGHGQTTAGIAALATAAQVEAALRALPIIAGAGAPVLKSVTGNWPDYSAEFFLNSGVPFGGQNVLVGNATGLSPAYKIKTALAFHGDRSKGLGPVQSIRLSPASTAGISRLPVLVGETARRARGRLLYWDRLYCNIPAPYVEYQGYNYQMQRMQNYRVLWNSFTDTYGQRHDQYINFIRLSEYSEPLIATFAYSFVLGSGNPNNPGLIQRGAKFYIPYRIIHYKDSFGTEYVYSVGTWGVAEPTEATRWKGDIWRIKNVIVSPY